MKNTFIICLALLAVSACASQSLNSGLPHLVGKKIDYAIGYLGHPNSESKIAGKKVYMWGNSRTFTTTQTVSTPISGTAYGLGGGVSYYGRTTSVVPQVHNYQCTIRLITNDKDIVERWEWNGNEGGCRQYKYATDRMAQTEELWLRAAQSKSEVE